MPTLTKIRRRAALAAGLAASLVAPAAALAGGGDAVIRDCTDDGRLSRQYTQAQYADALKNIPTDVDEYTDCRDVIKRAQLAAAGGRGAGGGSGSGGGGGFAGGGATGGGGGGAVGQNVDNVLAQATPQERRAIDRIRETGAGAPVVVGDRTLTPSQLAKTDLGELSTVPTPLLIVLALLVIASLTGAGSAVLTRVRTHRAPGV